jgi:hypothetical protein
MTATTRPKASALDADVPRTGRAADAYEVAQTTLRLCEAWDRTEGDQGNLAPARHAVTLHRISGHLHKLAERECNEDLHCTWCDGSGQLTEDRIHRNPRMEIKPTRVVCRACAGHGTTVGRRLAKLQADAREIAEHYGMTAYFVDDPRGCSLYLIDPGTLPGEQHLVGRYQNATQWLSAGNYTRGHAVVRLGR